MKPDRLNALTDGVVAIVLTIMVLELKFPAEPTLRAALAGLPLLAAYLLAFTNVAIFWNNHHHMMQSAHRVTGAVLWANHSLLFCLTLFPLMIRWIDEAGEDAARWSVDELDAGAGIADDALAARPAHGALDRDRLEQAGKAEDELDRRTHRQRPVGGDEGGARRQEIRSE